MKLMEKQYKNKFLCRNIQRNNWYRNTKSSLGWKQAIINVRCCCWIFSKLIKQKIIRISFIYKWWKQTRCTWFTFLYVYFIQIILESGLLVSGMPTVLEDTGGCAKQYRCALDIYLFNVLPTLYGIIMDHAINAPGHRNNIFNSLNTNDKCFIWRDKWDLLVN